MKTLLLPISALIPTRNRTIPLRRMLESLAQQSAQPLEIIVVDSSANNETQQACENEFPGLAAGMIYHRAKKAGAAAQRNQAVRYASQDTVWFIDDDVIFEPDCLLKLWQALQNDPALGGVSAMIANQQYAAPGLTSRLLFRFLNGRAEKSYAGKCIGPALNLLPEDRPDLPEVVPVEWLNTTCTLYRKEALPEPLFPEFFTGYSMMEDLALSLVVGRKWKLANARTARIFHESQITNHKNNLSDFAEMELVNRHYVMKRILNRKKVIDYFKLAVLEFFNLFSRLFSFEGWEAFPAVLRGKLRAVREILAAS